MIIIDKKAYDAAIKNKSSFVIKPVSVSCSWAGPVKSLWIGLMKDFNDNENYYEFIIDSIKVYIHKSLAIEENIEIKLLFHIPFLGNSFKVKGINIKYKI